MNDPYILTKQTDVCDDREQQRQYTEQNSSNLTGIFTESLVGKIVRVVSCESVVIHFDDKIYLI